MGFFDFLKSSLSSSNNIETENGINEIYFDNGKSDQIQRRFILKNGKRDGLVEEFFENGNILGKYQYVNGLQHGLTQSFNIDGSIFRESKFENNERIGTQEFYSDGNLRFEYDNKKYEYTFYSKSGKKTLIIYINIYRNPISHMSFSSLPESYKSKVFNPGVHNRIEEFPLSKWKVFNDKEEIIYEMDFEFFPDDALRVDTVKKNHFNSAEQIISSEILDISEINTKFFSEFEMNTRRTSLMDIEVKIDDIIKLKKIEIDKERLSFFLKESDNLNIYAFERQYCSMKFIYEFMVINGGFESYDVLKNDVEVKYEWEKPWEFKNKDYCIRLDYLKNKYTYQKTSFHDSVFTADQPYVVSIETFKIVNNNIINENDLIDIGIVSHYEGKPFTGTAHVLYEDGNIKMETQFKNGLKDGYQKVFFNSGQLSIEYLFKEDKLQKVVKRFLRDGTPMKKIDDFCISFLLKKMSGIDNDVNQNEIQFIENTLSSINFSNDDYTTIESQIKENNNVEDFVNSHLVCFSGENIISLFTLLLSVMVADGEIDRREKYFLFKIGSNFKMNENDIKELILKIDQQFDGKLLKNNDLEF